jgi:hypothetical protein
MIPKRGNRVSEEIMLNQEAKRDGGAITLLESLCRGDRAVTAAALAQPVFNPSQ